MGAYNSVPIVDQANISITGGTIDGAVIGGTTPAAGTFTTLTGTTGVWTTATELTLASDAITVTQTLHLVDTQSDAASDDLATINGGAAGQLLAIRAAHADRTVVIKNGTGNILSGGADITLDDTNKYVLFVYDGTLTKWVVVGGTGGGGATSDYQYIPVDAGMDSVIAYPDATIRVQGAVGSQLLINGESAVWSAGATAYDTMTVNANHIDLDALVYSTTGTQTAVSNSITIVAGKLYRIVATETHTSGAHIVLSGTGGVPTTTLAAGANNIYFRATGTATVITLTNTAAASNACTFTLYEYTRPVYAREFSNSTQQALVFDWLPPTDWNAGTITFIPYFAVTNATAPANTETVIMQLSGIAIGPSDSLSQATGTAQTSTFTADATYLQYDAAVGAESAAITIANTPAAGKKVRLILDRLTTGTYAQKIGVTGIGVKFTRTLAA
jgi:hypothetical protein